MSMFLRYRVSFIFAIMGIFFLSNLPAALAYEKEIKGLATTIANDMSSMGTQRIAVVDFTNFQGRVTELGRLIAEDISIELVNSKSDFQVIDRTHMNTILRELSLSSSDLFDPKRAGEFGKLARADAILTGSVTPFGDMIRVNLKVISTKSGRVISGVRRSIVKTKAISSLLERDIETRQRVKSNRQTKDSRRIKAKRKKAGKNLKASNYVWEDNVLKVIAESMKKKKKSLVLTVWFENKSKKWIHIDLDEHNTFLSDENGERWYYSSDTLKFWVGRDLPPGGKLRTRMIFKVSDTGNGTGRDFDLFTRADDYNCHKFVLFLKDLRAR